MATATLEATTESTPLTAELLGLKQQLQEALVRIKDLEERLQSTQEAQRWNHLIARPHAWRRQLSLRDRKMTVGQLVSTVYANKLSPEEASQNLDLDVEAIQEALAYYEQHRDLVQKEAAEERRILKEWGVALEPKDLSR